MGVQHAFISEERTFLDAKLFNASLNVCRAAWKVPSGDWARLGERGASIPEVSFIHFRRVPFGASLEALTPAFDSSPPFPES